MSESMRGRLLIASPALADWFRRTVVLVVEHNEEGPMGVALNKPLGLSLEELAPELTDVLGGDWPVYEGGPVGAGEVVVVADFEDPAEAGVQLGGDMGLLDPERMDVAVRQLRVFAGYAGWGPGQLDDELEHEAWIVEQAQPDDPFDKADLWPTALERKGGGYALLATMPEDASLN